MQTYATLADVTDRVPRDDLAERVAPHDHEVTGDVLYSYIVDGDRGADLDPDADNPAQLEAATERAVKRITRALEDASRRIDGYLAGRYPALTVAQAPALRGVCLDLALYHLFGGGEPGTSGADRKAAHDEARRWLGEVGRGAIDLPLDGAGAAAATDAAKAAAGQPVFSGQTLGDYLPGV